MTCMLDEDEADIEADIQRELDALGNDCLQIEDLEDETPTTPRANEVKDNSLPDSIEQYLRLLHSRTEGAEEEVKECELILEKLPVNDGGLKDDEALLAKRIKDELGDDFEEQPLVLRDQVLSELEEAELKEEQEKQAAENRDEDKNMFALEVVRPGVIEEIQALEEKAQLELQELEKKQTGKFQEREKWYQERKEEEEARQEKERLARIQHQVEFEAAQDKLLKEQQVCVRFNIMQAVFFLSAGWCGTLNLAINCKSFVLQMEIRAIEEERKRQNEAFIEAQQKEAQYQQEKRSNAATKIQKCYKGYRVRKEYQPLLETKKQERMKKRQEELDRIERVERKLREDAERKKREEEQKRKEENEKKKREEEEKRKLEAAEKQRKLEEEKNRREEEKRKKEEEKRRFEEEQRIREEQQRKEEEQKRRLEEEKRIREEEKQKKEEEQEKLRKLEEEKRMKEEEQLKKQEQEKLRRFAEEERRREEEKRKKEQEERRKRVAEEKHAETERKWKVEEEERAKRVQENEKELREEQLRSTKEQKRNVEERIGKREKENKGEKEEFGAKKKEWEVEEWKEQEGHKEGVKMMTQDGKEESRKVEQTGKGLTPKTFEDGSQGHVVKSEPCDMRNEEEMRPSQLNLSDQSKVPSLALTEELEARRLLWLKEHVPLSSNLTAEERDHPVALKSKPRRAFSASKHLPALTEEKLLQSSSTNTPLFRVQAVAFRDEPSCSMRSLDKCPELRSLTLHNCGLHAVEGLEKCTELQELHLKNNKIEAINCRGLSKLEVISLADNNLASIHGFEGCISVVSLDLCNNKITRIGDLSMCNKLQELLMANNQLINTKGLSCLRNLQHLDLSQNHLARVTGIERCVLLQTLNLRANNLQEPPHLTDCVLLREIRLDDNSISSLDCLSSAWLPLLQLLSVSQNSISQLSPLENLISLETLDLSNNLISDNESLIPGLQSGGRRLKTLSIEGNPVQEDPDCRSSILQALPCLKSLDGEYLAGKDVVKVPNEAVFVDMCQRQLRSQKDFLLKQATQEISSDIQAYEPDQLSKRLQFMSQYHNERLELAVRHLREHETFAEESYQSTASKKTPRDLDARQTVESQNNQNKEKYSCRKQPINSLKQRHYAATKIQALWRGWYLRQLIKINTEKNIRQYSAYGDSSNGSPFPAKPRQAWRSADSPIVSADQLTVATTTVDHDELSVASGALSHQSHRAEELGTEWGFQNSQTTELMLRRARKMKYNPARRKKLLDPNKRLALFKKLEETHKLRDVKPPPTRRQPPKRVERVFSASKHLPALTEEKLLQSSPTNTPLFRVQAVALRDEPSCSMRSLDKCPELRSLTLHNCGLHAVEGLEKCTELQELHLKNNKIEAINFRGLSKLEVISLADNNLSSIHGFEGCISVVSLDLCNNKITRIGDLSMCNKLQELLMANNQLINTKGLSCLRNLQHLDLSQNHLARVTGIERCVLLQTLNLRANNLQEPPHLTDCVLLREIRLDDNSISSLDCLSSAWLPLLQLLSVSQNSISQLSPLENLISLETLDLSNNLISDTESLIPGLQSGGRRLKTLSIEGNPVQEDPDCRSSILKALPCLKSLDDEYLSGQDVVTAPNEAVFVDMCQHQLQSQKDLLLKQATQEISSDIQAYEPDQLSKRLQFMSEYHNERLELAVRHLREHETFAEESYQSTASKKTPRDLDARQTVESQNNQNKEKYSCRKQPINSLKQRHCSLAFSSHSLALGFHLSYI
ncbi:PREDICTED: leucine-rich repeat and IQ domain-containing protein 1-like [Acropora digitifera]|uniref:leucine-rich repeat and IQ domain-containing protein 1-like n=1 Tax=Acropora digitifera TaxID=70779 RepID=UPI00077A9BDC|nr:PREDICTED: leucine-rich repeat and IQ domain-containing protein 1-like [Acropora digitifera]